jgi:hypothetical protein
VQVPRSPRPPLAVVESGGGILVDNAELTPEWIELVLEAVASGR